MDIQAVRRRRLQALIDEKFDGKQARLAEAIDRQPGYISRCLKGSKGIGESFARYVEERINLPRGWLDTPQDEARSSSQEERPPLGEIEVNLLSAFSGLTVDQQRQALEAVLKVKTDNERIVAELSSRGAARHAEGKKSDHDQEQMRRDPVPEAKARQSA